MNPRISGRRDCASSRRASPVAGFSPLALAHDSGLSRDPSRTAKTSGENLVSDEGNQCALSCRTRQEKVSSGLAIGKAPIGSMPSGHSAQAEVRFRRALCVHAVLSRFCLLPRIRDLRHILLTSA